MAEYLSAFVGGCLIGLASVLMLLFNGKILGVSGIVGGLFQKRSPEQIWRYAFVTGLFAGGGILSLVLPSAFSFPLPRSLFALVAAGLMVGYGTRLGNGCTSGHGICGLARFSKRSLAAVAVFMGMAFLTVLIRRLGGWL